MQLIVEVIRRAREGVHRIKWEAFLRLSNRPGFGLLLRLLNNGVNGAGKQSKEPLRFD